MFDGCSMLTGDAYSSGHLVLSHLGFANVLLLRPLTLNHSLHHQFVTLQPIAQLTEYDSFPGFMSLSLIWLLNVSDKTEYRFPWGIYNGCSMLTGDAYSSGHLVPSHWGLAYVLLVKTNPFQIFRSWVAIFQPRPPMASLFRNLYDMHRLAPHMDALSLGQCDFQISFSNRDTSRNAWNRHWGSFMVDTGILSNNMKFPSHKC